jgi:5'-methylthioadenosine phosphorylase
MATPLLAVIGGSGLYQIDGMDSGAEDVRVRTPFGDPSDPITVGTIAGVPVAFLSRHGKGHRLTPTEINQRANIWALKSLGVEKILSISAVGSMREDYRPLDVVVPDQLVDRTRARPSTFFGNGLVAHVGFADPFCPALSDALFRTASQSAERVHRGGTYVCIEGPQFSTRAESRIYRQWGVDIIGMTALPEAKLAREAELCYATLALVTDYDVWHQSEEAVTVETVVANLTRNIAVAKQIILHLVPLLASLPECACGSALANAIITRPDAIPDAVKADLAPIVGKYLK